MSTRSNRVALAIVALTIVGGVAHAEPPRLYIREGFVSDIKVEPDPSAVMVSVTRKFTALSLEREAAIANDVCAAISALSQRDAGLEAVGLCDLVLVGTNNKIGATTFDEDGHPVTAWETWYLRSKKK